MDTAFYYHNLTDVIPDEYYLATDKHSIALKDPRVRQIYVNSDVLDLGVITMQHRDATFNIYDRERMLIELLRYKSKLPFDYYKENPLLFIIVGLIIIVMTVFTMSSEILSIIFPNDLRYKPEGTYCYYIIDEDNNAYPAKIEKVSYDEDIGEDYYGNSRTKTHNNINLLELYGDTSGE